MNSMPNVVHGSASSAGQVFSHPSSLHAGLNPTSSGFSAQAQAGMASGRSFSSGPMFNHQDPFPSQSGENMAFSSLRAATRSLSQVHPSPDQPSSAHGLAYTPQDPVSRQYNATNIAHSGSSGNFGSVLYGSGGYGNWGSHNITNSGLASSSGPRMAPVVRSASQNDMTTNFNPALKDTRSSEPMDAAMDRRFSTGSSNIYNSKGSHVGHGALAGQPVDNERPYGHSNGNLSLSDELLANIDSALLQSGIAADRVGDSNYPEIASHSAEEYLKPQSEVVRDLPGDGASAAPIESNASPKHEKYSDTSVKAALVADIDMSVNDGLSERPQRYRNKVKEALSCISEIQTKFTSLEDAQEKLKGKYEKPVEDPTIPTTITQKCAIVNALVEFWVDTSCSKDLPRYRDNFHDKPKNLEVIELHCWELLEATINITQEGPMCFKIMTRHTGNIGSFECRITAIMETIHCYKTKCDQLARTSTLYKLVHDPIGQQRSSKSNQEVNQRKALSLKIGNAEVKRRRLERNFVSDAAVSEQSVDSPRNDPALHHRARQFPRGRAGRPRRRTQRNELSEGSASQQLRLQLEDSPRFLGARPRAVRRRPLGDAFQEKQRRKREIAGRCTVTAVSPLHQIGQASSSSSSHPSGVGARRRSDPVRGSTDFALCSSPDDGTMGGYGTTASSCASTSNMAPQTPKDTGAFVGNGIPSWLSADSSHARAPYFNPSLGFQWKDQADLYGKPEQQYGQYGTSMPQMADHYMQMDIPGDG
ncbi:uncharacterized protein BDV14DRAFT_203512 [Aspergillus stella-maris]|uniref:uncharacterized protein n=1 Tax=Aspergillus stella-maris TaxID=1810926 RepID=UPI003CCDF999